MKKFKQYQDVIAGVAFLILSVAYYSGSFFETSSLMKAEYGPDFMPKVYAVLMGILSIALIVTGIQKAKKVSPSEEECVFDMRSAVTVALSLIFIGVYIFLIEVVGFLIASALYLFTQAWLLSQKKNYGLLILFSVIGAVAVYLLFAKGIGLTLPRGILGF